MKIFITIFYIVLICLYFVNLIINHEYGFQFYFIGIILISGFLTFNENLQKSDEKSTILGIENFNKLITYFSYFSIMLSLILYFSIESLDNKFSVFFYIYSINLFLFIFFGIKDKL